MPRTKSEYTRTLIDNNLHNLLTLLDATRTQVKNLQRKEADLVSTILEEMSELDGINKIDAHGFIEGMYPSYIVHVMDGRVGLKTIKPESTVIMPKTRRRSKY
jgi:hypothetical protein